MLYHVEWNPTAASQDLKGISRKDLERIKTHTLELEQEPRPPNAEKLRDDLYRVRVGWYRIVYQIVEQQRLVWILAVGHRKEVYRYLNRQLAGED